MTYDVSGWRLRERIEQAESHGGSREKRTATLLN